MNEEARKAFIEFFNGQTNFITSEILNYYKRGKYYIELSKGPGIFNDEIYGVTVLENDRGIIKRTDLSKAFTSKAAAMRFIKSL